VSCSESAGVRILPGDSLLVLQPGRATVLDPGGAFARTATPPPMQAAHALHVAPDGRLLYSSWIRTADRAGLQYHLMTPGFEPLRSFGAVPQQRQTSCSNCATYSATWSRTRPGHFWALAPNRYELELWHESGRLVERLEVAAPWFRAWDENPARTAGGAVRIVDGALVIGGERPAAAQPPHRLTRISEDDQGLVWVSAHVPSAQWAALPDPGPDRHPDARAMEQAQRNFDTVIEVIDPARGTLLASLRLPAQSLSALDAQTYWTRAQDPRTGLVQVQIWYAALVR
jgi:hypothetical protein